MTRLAARRVISLVTVALAASAFSAPVAARATDAPSTSAWRRVPGAQPSPGCRGAASRERAPDIERVRTLTVDGVDRTFRLSVPRTGRESGAPTPLIVLLHGLGSSADDVIAVTDLPERAAEEGTAVAVPDATGTPTLWQMGAGGADAAFIDALLTEIFSTACIDEARVSFAGFSAGAAFAITYACAHQSRVAALVTVAVEFPGSCTRPMPLTAIHGTGDPIVAYGDTPESGTRRNMASWAATARCAPEPTTKPVEENVTRTTWTACAGRSAVVLYTVTGGGHEWPRGAAVAGDEAPFDATTVAVRFLVRHRVPEAPREGTMG